MFAPDYEGNALTITDAQVMSDWRFGLLRKLAAALHERALLEGQEPIYAFDHVEPGSDAAHLARGECSIVEVYNVKETTGTEYIRNYDDSYPENYMKLTALGTCKCGRFVKKPIWKRMDSFYGWISRSEA